MPPRCHVVPFPRSAAVFVVITRSQSLAWCGLGEFKVVCGRVAINGVSLTATSDAGWVPVVATRTAPVPVLTTLPMLPGATTETTEVIQANVSDDPSLVYAVRTLISNVDATGTLVDLVRSGQGKGQEEWAIIAVRGPSPAGTLSKTRLPSHLAGGGSEGNMHLSSVRSGAVVPVVAEGFLPHPMLVHCPPIHALVPTLALFSTPAGQVPAYPPTKAALDFLRTEGLETEELNLNLVLSSRVEEYVGVFEAVGGVGCVAGATVPKPVTKDPSRSASSSEKSSVSPPPNVGYPAGLSPDPNATSEYEYENVPVDIYSKTLCVSTSTDVKPIRAVQSEDENDEYGDGEYTYEEISSCDEYEYVIEGELNGDGEESVAPKPPCVMVAGRKNSGKSTLVTTATQFLKKETGVVVLDLDPGQALWDAPGVVSVYHVVRPFFSAADSCILTSSQGASPLSPSVPGTPRTPAFTGSVRRMSSTPGIGVSTGFNPTPGAPGTPKRTPFSGSDLHQQKQQDGFSSRVRSIDHWHVGGISIGEDAELYRAGVTQAVCKAQIISAQFGAPILVNTPGWISGLGLQLLQEAMESACPTTFVWMDVRDPHPELLEVAKRLGTEVLSLPSISNSVGKSHFPLGSHAPSIAFPLWFPEAHFSPALPGAVEISPASGFVDGRDFPSGSPRRPLRRDSTTGSGTQAQYQPVSRRTGLWSSRIGGNGGVFSAGSEGKGGKRDTAKSLYAPMENPLLRLDGSWCTQAMGLQVEQSPAGNMFLKLSSGVEVLAFHRSLISLLFSSPELHAETSVTPSVSSLPSRTTSGRSSPTASGSVTPKRGSFRSKDMSKGGFFTEMRRAANAAARSINDVNQMRAFRFPKQMSVRRGTFCQFCEVLSRSLSMVSPNAPTIRARKLSAALRLGGVLPPLPVQVPYAVDACRVWWGTGAGKSAQPKEIFSVLNSLPVAILQGSPAHAIPIEGGDYTPGTLHVLKRTPPLQRLGIGLVRTVDVSSGLVFICSSLQQSRLPESCVVAGISGVLPDATLLQPHLFPRTPYLCGRVIASAGSKEQVQTGTTRRFPTK